MGLFCFINITMLTFRQFITEAIHPRTRITRYSKEEMIKNGADGHLSHGYDRYIPIHKLEGLEPQPTNTRTSSGEYHPGTHVTQPIEVKYNHTEDHYTVYGGNHRIAQAKANKDTHIRAYVESDKGRVGSHAKRNHPDYS